MGAKKSKSKKGEYEWSGDLRRIIPLKNNYCYVNDDKGKTPRMKRDSEDFYALALKLNEIMNGKIFRELEELGWTEQLKTLETMQAEGTDG
jgi:hypothetical protein